MWRDADAPWRDSLLLEITYTRGGIDEGLELRGDPISENARQNDYPGEPEPVQSGRHAPWSYWQVAGSLPGTITLRCTARSREVAELIEQSIRAELMIYRIWKQTGLPGR